MSGYIKQAFAKKWGFPPTLFFANSLLSPEKKMVVKVQNYG